MIPRVASACAALGLLLVPGLSEAQTGSQGPASTSTAAANAKAADEQSKSFTTPTAPGASILIGNAGQTENCAVPVSAGVGTLVYGATGVWAITVAGCEKRRTAWDIAALTGDTLAAKAELCTLSDVKESFRRAGHPCP